MMVEPRRFLRSLFDSAVSAAAPRLCMPPWLPRQPPGRVLIAGAGKAAASMAAELEKQWTGPLDGIVIVPHGYRSDCEWIEVIEASHPVPDEAGTRAAARILESVSGLDAGDTLVCLLSGGGSSLLCLPAEGVSLAEKQQISSKLLRSGAAIHEINCVRKKLSAIKGGKLAAAAAPASVLTLLISDVPGNDASMVASGPTVSDYGRPADALKILDRYNIGISEAARSAIERSDTLQVENGDTRILATSDDAQLAAAAVADQNGILPYALGDLSGDAREMAAEHAGLARQILAGTGPVVPPCVILSGGESTVRVSGDGRGGRNGEYLLALAIALDGHPSIHALACDTDGIDGAGDNAGAIIDPETLMRATRKGVKASKMLANNDSYAFFEKTADLVVTGPTHTNVNDIRAILISEAVTATA